MNVICISDFHLVSAVPSGRIDDTIKAGLGKLSFILEYASATYDCIVVQAGDFLDVPRSWYLLPRIAELFKAYKKVRWYSIFGQHDTYLYSELTRDATTLGVLNKTGILTILNDNNPVIEGNIRVYGCSFGTKVPEVDRSKNYKNVLVIHDHVSDRALFPNHKFKNAKKYLRRYEKFDLILVGDIHRKFEKKIDTRRIINTGPIVRTRNTEYMKQHKPGFYVWNTDTNKIKWVTIPHEPNEKVFVDKVKEPTENEQMRIISSIENIKQTDSYKIESELNRVLVEMFEEYSTTENVKELLYTLLGETNE